MMDDENLIIIDHDLHRLGQDDSLSNHIAHILCTGGQCWFRFNGKDNLLSEGNAMVLPLQRLAEDIRPSSDFQVTCIYIRPEIIEIPRAINGTKMRGSTEIFTNPIIHLNKEEYVLILRDFLNLEWRLAHREQVFRDRTLYHAMQNMVLDLCAAYFSRSPNDVVSSKYVEVMAGFIGLLENREYVQHRTLDYYSDKLNVTPKYLSNVTRSYTGKGGSYWINRFTIIYIRKLLDNTMQSLSEIAEDMGFSSLAHFNTFFRKHMGMNPSDYRNKSGKNNDLRGGVILVLPVVAFIHTYDAKPLYGAEKSFFVPFRINYRIKVAG